ncbi:hypothetical protein SAMN04488577_2080 [Bacillus sp. cl95]|nr:hypothetical protein SAMN02799634_103449 [Bacillus sp. UNCCL13]SFQ81698.1 hypothetical protein SAMN04488577_2080 [Bacillus sp. cl95]
MREVLSNLLEDKHIENYPLFKEFVFERTDIYDSLVCLI